MIEGQLGRVVARAVRDVGDDDEVIALIEALLELHQASREVASDEVA